MHFLPEFVTFFVFATLSKEVLLSVSEKLHYLYKRNTLNTDPPPEL